MYTAPPPLYQQPPIDQEAIEEEKRVRGARRLGCLLIIPALLIILAGLIMSQNPSLFHFQKKASAPKAPSGQIAVQGDPTVDAQFIDKILCKYGSPTCGMGQNLYDLGVKYGIDPVIALAFFFHESFFGTTGEARVTKGLGNPRCLDQKAYRGLLSQCPDGYQWFVSWKAGFEAFYICIQKLYLEQFHAKTVEQIVPRYAPSGDKNDVHAYIRVVRAAVSLWRAGKVALPS